MLNLARRLLPSQYLHGNPILLMLFLALAIAACSPATTIHTIQPGETSSPTSSQSRTPTQAAAEATATTTPRSISPSLTPTEAPTEVSASAPLPITSPVTSERKGAPAAQPGVSVKNKPPDDGQRGTPPQGRSYTWQDGERTITVFLQEDLIADQYGNIRAGLTDDEQGAVRGQDDQSGDTPVFLSHSGSRMTLPGGVMLALDQTWSTAEVNAFFKLNAVALSDVSGLDYLTNGFFIETAPGFPSLELANSMAEQDGVVAASPNWRTRVVTK